MKFTPEVITSLKKNEVFVFGSNESGIHGAGAAALAQSKFGAVYGVGFGLQGQSFAIPTKDWSIRTLPLDVVDNYVQRFIDFAETNSKKVFFVTKIGCGLAGFLPQDIAPLFAGAIDMPNVVLPKDFVKIINSIISP